MDDERAGPSAAFALRLTADLLTALVVSGTIQRRHAETLIDDALVSLLQSHAEYERPLREIAATLTAQVQVVSIEADIDRARPSAGGGRSPDDG